MPSARHNVFPNRSLLLRCVVTGAPRRLPPVNFAPLPSVQVVAQGIARSPSKTVRGERCL
eukprot:560676-Pyramimonas_sp.AAC.1